MSELAQLQAELAQLKAEQAQLHLDLARTQEVTALLHTATLALTQSLNLEQILEQLLATIAQLVDYDSAVVFLVEKNHQLVVKALHGYEQWTDPEIIRHTQLTVETTPYLTELFQAKKTALVTDAHNDPYWQPMPAVAYVRSWLGVPLVFENQVLGLFSLDKAEPHYFTANHVYSVEVLAAHAAVAINNARLYQQLQTELQKRQAVEAVSWASEQKYRELVEGANTIILEWDKTGLITFMNDFGLTFFGYKTEELIGQNIMGTIVPRTESSGRDLEFLMQDIVVHPELYEHNENENVTKTGQRVWCVWSNTPRFDARGRLTGILSIANDITPQKLAKLQIQRQNGYLASLHETTLGLLGRLELHELLEDIIRRAAQLFDTSHGSIYFVEANQRDLVLQVGIGLFSDKVGMILKPGESMPGLVWLTEQALFVNDYATWSGRSPNVDYSNLRAGIGVPLTHVNPTDQKAHIVGVLGLAYDIHSTQIWDEESVALLTRFAQLASVALDNARLYDEAQTARQAAESANEAKGAFLANVSHELRTPLTSVLGFAKIIAKRLDLVFPHVPTPDRKTQRAMEQITQNIEIIIAEGERLTALINDVLDLAKIEAGKIEWHMQPLELPEIINRAVSATSSLFAQREVDLLIQLDYPLPQVIGDPDRLIQVMINLISNASKFTHQGSVTCKAQARGTEVIVSVIDTGIGISASDQTKVFDKFRQVGNTLTDKPQGTGLGLPICKEIIANHEGRIWLESDIGRGTTVSFSLPIMASAVVNNALAEAWIKKLDIDLLLEQFEIHQRLARTHSHEKKTILVVDDDTNIRQMLVQELEAKGYQVLQARDGLEAMTQVKQNRPDLVTLDVMMPKMNGFDVAVLLKNDPVTANIPIILLTIVEDEPRGYRLGVDRYFRKPIDMPKLFAEIELLIAQGGSKKSVLIIDQCQGSEQPLTQIFQGQGYYVTQLAADQSLIQAALKLKPDMIIINSDHPEQHYESIHMLRYEPGFEHIMFFFFQETH